MLSRIIKVFQGELPQIPLGIYVIYSIPTILPFFKRKKKAKLDIMVHVCTPSYLEADAGGSLET
jgi:hypothetical protein